MAQLNKHRVSTTTTKRVRPKWPPLAPAQVHCCRRFPPSPPPPPSGRGSIRRAIRCGATLAGLPHPAYVMIQRQRWRHKRALGRAVSLLSVCLSRVSTLAKWKVSISIWDSIREPTRAHCCSACLASPSPNPNSAQLNQQQQQRHKQTNTHTRTLTPG